MIAILKEAAQRAGGVTELATAIGLTRSALYQWTRIPAERVIDIEEATGISRDRLRPDLFAQRKKKPR